MGTETLAHDPPEHFANSDWANSSLGFGESHEPCSSKVASDFCWRGPLCECIDESCELFKEWGSSGRVEGF